MSRRAEEHEAIQVVFAGPSLDWLRRVLPSTIQLALIEHDPDDLPVFVMQPTDEAMAAMRDVP